MARVKKTGSEIMRRTGPAQKRPRAVVSTKAPAPAKSIRKPHCFRPGTRALLKIRKFQRRSDLLIKCLSFERFVREIAQDYMVAPRFRPDAMDALETAAENYLVNLFEDTNLISIHAKRQTISVRDFNLRAKLGVKLIRVKLYSIKFSLA